MKNHKRNFEIPTTRLTPENAGVVAKPGYFRFPCPFCGSYFQTTYHTAEQTYIVCEGCGASGPPTNWKAEGDMTEVATHAWNRRSDLGRGS